MEVDDIELEKYTKNLEDALRRYDVFEIYRKLLKVLKVERKRLERGLMERGIDPELFARFLYNPQEFVSEDSYETLDDAAYHLVRIFLRSLAYASPKKAFLLIISFLSSYFSYKHFSKKKSN